MHQQIFNLLDLYHKNQSNFEHTYNCYLIDYLFSNETTLAFLLQY